MKRKLCIFAAVLAAVCMICSCGGGSGSSEAQDAVAVTLAVSSADGNLSKSISATSTDLLTSAVYQYKATANWTSEFGTVQGTQATWKTFTKGSAIGYFAPGSWTFHVRVVKNGTESTDDSESVIVLYKTAAAGVPGYVNPSVTSEAPIEIAVSKVNTGKGTIAFGGTTKTLSAPTCSANEKLVATYGKVGTTTVSGTVNLTKGTASGGFTPFTGTKTGVDAGVYWVTITRNDGTNDVGASTTMVEIYAGQTETISGTVESGKWVNTFFKITGIKEITGNISTTTTSVVKGTAISFTIGGEITENGIKDTTATNAMKYYLCVDGAMTSITPTSGTYSWATSSVPYGNYEVGLIVTDANNTISASASDPILVTIKESE